MQLVQTVEACTPRYCSFSLVAVLKLKQTLPISIHGTHYIFMDQSICNISTANKVAVYFAGENVHKFPLLVTKLAMYHTIFSKTFTDKTTRLYYSICPIWCDSGTNGSDIILMADMSIKLLYYLWLPGVRDW